MSLLQHFLLLYIKLLGYTKNLPQFEFKIKASESKKVKQQNNIWPNTDVNYELLNQAFKKKLIWHKMDSELRTYNFKKLRSLILKFLQGKGSPKGILETNFVPTAV